VTIKEIVNASGKKVELVRRVIKELMLPVVRGPNPKDYNKRDTDRILKALEKRGNKASK
jgi:hypothetical protein